MVNGAVKMRRTRPEWTSTADQVVSGGDDQTAAIAAADHAGRRGADANPPDDAAPWQVGEDHVAVAGVVRGDPPTLEQEEKVGLLAALEPERRQLRAGRVRVERLRHRELGLRRRRGPERSAREKQRALRIAPELAARAGRDGLRSRGPLRLHRVAPTGEREDQEPDGHEEEQSGADECAAQPAVGPQLVALRPRRLVDARVDEVALRRVEQRALRARELDRRIQARPAVEVGGLPRRGVPQPGRVPETPMQANPLAVLVEPPAQRRPAADEHLVRDLCGALVQGHEARLDQPLEQRPHRVGRGPLGDELIDVDPSPSVLHIVAELGEAQEHAAQQRAVGFRCVGQHRVGGLGDSRAHTAGFVVGRHGERPPVPALPRLAERVGHQRQRTRFAGDVAQHEVDETRLEAQAGQPRGLGDGAAEVVVAHWPEQHLVAGHGGGELGVGAQLAVEVRPQADHDRPRAGEEVSDKPLPAPGVIALRVQLLELIDDQKLTLGVAQVERRVRAPGA